MKILVGIPEPTARGGINACEPPFLAELRAQDHELEELVTAFDNPPDISLTTRVRQVWRAARALRRKIEAEEFDVVHLNSAFDRKAIIRDVFTLFQLRQRKVPVFLKLHGSESQLLTNARFVMRFLIRELLKRTDALGVLSTEEKESFEEFGAPPEKIFVVKNVVAGESFPPVEKPDDAPFRLVFAARLIASKGAAEVIQAVGVVRQRGYQVTLSIYGDGPEKSSLEALSKELGLTDFISFHGHVSEDEVANGYAASDILVFPTCHDEGFPMVVFKALQFGLPIITTRIRASADYLKDRENCLFCGGRNPASVAGRIAEMIDNAELRERISANNRALADEFSAAKVVPEYLAIYESLSR
jgi:glycosyltransferase involved in cell wall biosynthesis